MAIRSYTSQRYWLTMVAAIRFAMASVAIQIRSTAGVYQPQTSANAITAWQAYYTVGLMHFFVTDHACVRFMQPVTFWYQFLHFRFTYSFIYHFFLFWFTTLLVRNSLSLSLSLSLPVWNLPAEPAKGYAEKIYPVRKSFCMSLRGLYTSFSRCPTSFLTFNTSRQWIVLSLAYFVDKYTSTISPPCGIRAYSFGTGAGPQTSSCERSADPKTCMQRRRK